MMIVVLTIRVIVTV